MPAGDEVIGALRAALAHSPENVPLRLHLADTLLGLGRAGEAEREYREALALAPDHAGLKAGLAGAFYAQGKPSHALVLVEDLLKRRDVPARVYLLHARLLMRLGEPARAAAQYRLAIETDPAAADPELADRLGVPAPTPERPYDPHDEDTDEEIVGGRMRASWEAGADTAEIEIERPDVTFADVGGMDAQKDEIRIKIIHPLEHPELYRAYGKPIGGGILLYGPPGCGKTHLARATAGEIAAQFLSIGINDILDMWIGRSEQNLHELFEQARRSRPCVLFIDEVDALAASRTDLRASGGRQLVNQFLAELDGIQSTNEGVLILAATNAPWHLDPAFRRPGRFDRILFVPPPDAPARAAILRVLCKGRPVHDVEYDQVARKTDGFSGADLKAVVDLAIEAKLREAMKLGAPKPLTTRDFLDAARGVKPSTREWFATARNYALYANKDGVYDEILKYVKPS